MKFIHDFKLEEAGRSYRKYRDGDVSVRLDFFDSILRVAILRDGEYLMPTYTVAPDGCAVPKEGRDKLSTEGFELAEPECVEKDGILEFELNGTKVAVELRNFRLSLTNDKGLLYTDRDNLAYNFEHEYGPGSMHCISREDDEKIFGLGDKTGHVNKNGMSFKLATGDAAGFDARTSDPLYKQLPFYICENSKGAYGLYYDTYSNGEFSFGKEINRYYMYQKMFRCNEENLVYYIILGTVPQIVNRFSKMCGRNCFPPEWTLKYCGSTMAYTDAPDADRQLRHFLEMCEKYGFSAGGFYLSSGYSMSNGKRCVFCWNTDKIPSPEGLAEHFKQHGVEFIANIKPAFLTEHPLYAQIAEKGWFLHYKDGSPYVFPFWTGMGSYLDFTNPGAYAFWTDCVKKSLIDKGYLNTWNDNNEYDVTSDEVYACGFGHEIKARDIRPLFSYLMTMASLEAQDSSTRKMSVSRSGIGGLQRLATTWTGDNYTGFADFRYQHYQAMTMSLSGFYNFGQDIGGFAGPTPSRELLLRWIKYGIFTPRFVLHSWNEDGGDPTMPWLYEDIIPVVKQLFDLRESFIPYLYNEMYRSVCTHDPIIYPVFLKYPGYDTEADCFFFGDSILACPVFDEGATSVTVRLPEHKGGWFLNDKIYSGEVTIQNLPEDMPVYFIKAGSVVPMKYDGETVLEVYPLEDGEFTYTYFADDGVSNLSDRKYRTKEIKVSCTPETITVYGCEKNETIVVYNEDERKVVAVYDK